jgi:hypothetical protein
MKSVLRVRSEGINCCLGTLEQRMLELTATIAYYSMISCTLNAFELSSSPDPDDFPI